MRSWIKKRRGHRPKPVEAIRQTGSRAAVVFIHGYLGNAEETWGDLHDLLAAQSDLKGWDIFAVSYASSAVPRLWEFWRWWWSADPSISKLAKRLKTTLESSLARYESVALVAHSMGGLVVQKVLLDAQVRRRVSYAFLFGTPSLGTEKARFIRFAGKRQIEDMRPESRFIKSLRSDWEDTFGSGEDFSSSFDLQVAAGSKDIFVREESSLSAFPKRVQHVVPGDHSQMVKPEEEDHPSFRLISGKLAGNYFDPFDGARLAVEKNNFYEAVGKFRGRADELDLPTLVQYAIALDHTGERDEAINVLKAHGKEGTSETDAMGTLAGRFKRRWKQDRTEHDAKEALELYERAYEKTTRSDQQYYHAINVAFMHLSYRQDRRIAGEWADRALGHCEDSLEGVWRFATMGEAHLVHRRAEKALTHYEYALRLEPEPWETRSMYEQAVVVAEEVDLPGGAGPLEALFESYERKHNEA